MCKKTIIEIRGVEFVLHCETINFPHRDEKPMNIPSFAPPSASCQCSFLSFSTLLKDYTDRLMQSFISNISTAFHNQSAVKRETFSLFKKRKLGNESDLWTPELLDLQNPPFNTQPTRPGKQMDRKNIQKCRVFSLLHKKY